MQRFLSAAPLWAAAVIATALLVCGPVQRLIAAPPTESLSEVLDSDELTVTGMSKLIRTDTGVNLTLVTSGLEPGAYTCWFAVFNHPENCGDPAGCGINPDDFLPASEGGTTGFGFTYATGHVVDRSGKAVFAANLNEGTVLLNDFLDLDEVFQDARAAEIHLIVRYHGPAEPGRIYEQTHTLEPDLGIGPDVDVQFSVHPAP
jgi:hypothetical protein